MICEACRPAQQSLPILICLGQSHAKLTKYQYHKQNFGLDIFLSEAIYHYYF